VRFPELYRGIARTWARLDAYAGGNYPTYCVAL